MRRASWPAARSALIGVLLAATSCGPAALAQENQSGDAAVNPAGIQLSVTPAGIVAVGTTFGFHLTSRQPGFLVLLDINADGVVSQLYPNVFTMNAAKDAGAASADPCATPGANTLSTFGLAQGANTKENRIEPGRPFDLPGGSAGADYAFQACPPKGGGMVFAVLSDKPVQIIDLPDIPAGTVGSPAGLDRLLGALKQLRLVSGEAGAPAVAPRWSIAWTRYEIR